MITDKQADDFVKVIHSAAIKTTKLLEEAGIEPQEKIELLPCPFCGGTEINTGAFSYCPDCFIKCETCGANFELEVPWEDMDEKEHDKKCYELLKEKWNTRINNE